MIYICVLHVLKILQLFSEEDSDIYCKLNEIRPRARNVVEITDLKEGQTVMINYNTDHHLEKGYWFVIPIFSSILQSSYFKTTFMQISFLTAWLPQNIIINWFCMDNPRNAECRPFWITMFRY